MTGYATEQPKPRPPRTGCPTCGHDGCRLVVLTGEGEVPPPDVMERNRRQAGQDHDR